jgi:hypothetical protein
MAQAIIKIGQDILRGKRTARRKPITYIQYPKTPYVYVYIYTYMYIYTYKYIHINI